MQDSALRSRLIAGGLHLLISVAIAVVTTGLILGVWYPPPYAQLSGGLRLVLLLVGVDTCLGPLLTLVVFDVAKPKAELRRDLAIIATLQVAALFYGLNTAAQARPLFLMFEQDRFRVIVANDIMDNEFPQALPEFRKLPWLGPRLAGTRQVRSGQEKLEAIDLALRGYDLGQRPSFWLPYDDVRPRVLATSRPIAALIGRYAKDADHIRLELARLGLSEANTRFLALQAQKIEWAVLIDQTGTPVGFLAYDGFF